MCRRSFSDVATRRGNIKARFSFQHGKKACRWKKGDESCTYLFYTYTAITGDIVKVQWLSDN